MKKLTKYGVVASTVAAIIGGIFAVEGGYVDNPNDPGGKTNHGVTEVVARDHGYTGHMRDLTKDEATVIYATDYIEKPGYLPLLSLSPAIAEEVIDSGVNAGTGRSSRWLQTSLNSLTRGGRDCPLLVVDGQVGNRTIETLRCLQRVRGTVKTCELVLKLMDAQQGAHYLALERSDPKFNTFMVGWFDHRVGNVPLSKCSTYQVQ